MTRLMVDQAKAWDEHFVDYGLGVDWVSLTEDEKREEITQWLTDGGVGDGMGAVFGANGLTVQQVLDGLDDDGWATR